MARLALAEVFDPSEVAVLHLCARVVRRCFLFGVDPVTGKNQYSFKPFSFNLEVAAGCCCSLTPLTLVKASYSCRIGLASG